ncbi:hypothetical protein QQF64_004090 [Cirrhinus molitorella]|uniref:BAR domain-containing protein n=1 Tax=Cirrhinus molitorella TaxID=172907 RepID=A0ABR3MN63_9TELE
MRRGRMRKPQTSQQCFFKYAPTANIDEVETDVVEIEAKLDKLVKLCSGMIEAGRAYISANKLFVNGIRDLSHHCKKEEMISECLEKCGESLQEIVNYHMIIKVCLLYLFNVNACLDSIMPKPSSSNKVKNADDQATGASAKPSSPDTCGKIPDTAYAMCREVCKEMSDSILQGVNARFDAFELTFQKLVTSQAELQARVANQELACNDFEARIRELETRYSELLKQNGQLRTKVLDLEARSRRHNIKIVGIQEGEEEGKPTEFVSRLIPQLLGEEYFPHPVKVDRAHRSLQPKPAVGEKPRTILARIHHFQEKELILRRGRMQPLEYKGKRVLIFPDYTTR